MSKKIIVIHSHQDLSSLLEMWLIDDGYKPQLYSDREQAGQDLLKIQPDLVIIEPSFGNPQADWQYIRTLRATSRSFELPVILCTVDTANIEKQNIYFQEQLKNIAVQPFENEPLLEALKVIS